MHGFYWGWGHGPLWGGGILMILFWACIIFLIIAIIKGIFNREQRPETALDILQKRYASGDISKEEFEEMKRDINS